MKHTSGPWIGPFVWDKDKPWKLTIGGDFRSRGRDHIVSLDCSGNDTEQIANAHLIAAAPELKASCDYALDLLSRNEPLSEEQRHRLLASLSGSVAKAEGEKP